MENPTMLDRHGLTGAYAQQHNGNWEPLTLPVTLRNPPPDVPRLPSDSTLQVWLDWDDVQAIMARVATQPPRPGNWTTLTDGGGPPDVGIYAVDQWGRPYSDGLSRVHVGLGCLVAMWRQS